MCKACASRVVASHYGAGACEAVCCLCEWDASKEHVHACVKSRQCERDAVCGHMHVRLVHGVANGMPGESLCRWANARQSRRGAAREACACGAEGPAGGMPRLSS